MLRRKGGATASKALRSDLLTAREPLSREAFTEQLGADPTMLLKSRPSPRTLLMLTETNLGARTIKLSGTLSDLTAAFKPTLKVYRAGKSTFRGRTGSITVPADWQYR